MDASLGKLEYEFVMSPDEITLGGYCCFEEAPSLKLRQLTLLSRPLPAPRVRSSVEHPRVLGLAVFNSFKTIESVREGRRVSS